MTTKDILPQENTRNRFFWWEFDERADLSAFSANCRSCGVIPRQSFGSRQRAWGARWFGRCCDCGALCELWRDEMRTSVRWEDPWKGTKSPKGFTEGTLPYYGDNSKAVQSKHMSVFFQISFKQVFMNIRFFLRQLTISIMSEKRVILGWVSASSWFYSLHNGGPIETKTWNKLDKPREMSKHFYFYLLYITINVI